MPRPDHGALRRPPPRRRASTRPAPSASRSSCTPTGGRDARAARTPRRADLSDAGQSLSLLGDTALWLALGAVGQDAHRVEQRRRPGDLLHRRAAARGAAVGAAGRPRPPPQPAAGRQPAHGARGPAAAARPRRAATSGSSTPSRSPTEQLHAARRRPVRAAGDDAAEGTAGERERVPADGARGAAARRPGRRRRPLHRRRRRRGRAAGRGHVRDRHRHAAGAALRRAAAGTAPRSVCARRSAPARGTSSARRRCAAW